MSHTLIIGDKGSMGRRYSAILNHLEKPFIGVDEETPIEKTMKIAEKCEGVIVCTPTETHFQMLVNLQPLKKKILCEKPLTKSHDELKVLFDLYKDQDLKMVMQYRELDPHKYADSFYDYYNHGKDGLLWDCIQVIGLARKKVTLAEKSPVWKCELNGAKLKSSDMDHAYIHMIRHWFNDPKDDLSFLMHIHNKVIDLGKNAQP